MSKCFSDLQIPCHWVPDLGYGYGYPLFLFYAPGPFYIGALMHSVGVQYIDVVKLLFVIGVFSSSVCMYLAVKKIFSSSSAGVIAATLYAYTPIKASEIYVRGSLSEFLSFIFFPLLFWSLVKDEKATPSINFAFTLSVAALLLTHNLMAFIFIPIACVWAIVISRSKPGGYLTNQAISLLLGFGVSSFFLLPLLFEKQFIHTESLTSGYFGYLQHFVSLYQLFISNHFGYGSSQLGMGDDITISLGHVNWVLGLVGVMLALKNFRDRLSKAVLAIAAIVLMIIFLMHQRSTPIWEIITPLQFLQFPWRLLVITSFLLSLIAGYVVSKIYNKTIMAATILVIFLLYGNFFQPKSWENTSDKIEFSGQKFLDQMTISIFDYLPISAKFPPNKIAPPEPEIILGDASISSYEKKSDSQSGKIEVLSSQATIRAPLFQFPGMQARIDNQPVQIQSNCTNQPYCFGLITIDVPYGEHQIDFVLKNTPIRSLGNLISLSSLIFIIGATCRKKYFSH